MPDSSGSQSDQKNDARIAAAFRIINGADKGVSWVTKILLVLGAAEMAMQVMRVAAALVATAGIAFCVAWAWARSPQLSKDAITTASLTACSNSLGVPINIDHNLAVQIVQFLIDKKLVDDQDQRLLPEVRDAFVRDAFSSDAVARSV